MSLSFIVPSIALLVRCDGDFHCFVVAVGCVGRANRRVAVAHTVQLRAAAGLPPAPQRRVLGGAHSHSHGRAEQCRDRRPHFGRGRGYHVGLTMGPQQLKAAGRQLVWPIREQNRVHPRTLREDRPYAPSVLPGQYYCDLVCSVFIRYSMSSG